MPSARIPRSAVSVAEHLGWQFDFLDASIERFDSGHEYEAQRMAVALRVMCASKPSGRPPSVSLLEQAGLDAVTFLDTANPSPWRLLVVEMPPDRGPRLRAPVQRHDEERSRWVAFADWWNGPAFELGPSRFTRGDIVAAVANTDGGAHLDTGSEPKYHALITASPPGATHVPEVVVRHPVWELLRQISYELQVSMHTARPDIAPPPRERHLSEGSRPSVYLYSVELSTDSREGSAG